MTQFNEVFTSIELFDNVYILASILTGLLIVIFLLFRKKLRLESSGHDEDIVEIRFQDVNENIKLIQTAYAITLVLGFRELAISIYRIFNSFLDPNIPFETYHVYHLVALFTTAFCGFRMFWCLGNLTRFISYHYFTDDKTFPKRLVANDPKQEYFLLASNPDFRIRVIANVIVLFTHSFLIFLLSQVLKVDYYKGETFSQSYLYAFFGLYILLLSFNAIWLRKLAGDKEEFEIEDYWSTNNWLASTICISVLIISNGLLRIQTELELFVHIGNIIVLFVMFYNSVNDVFSTVTSYVFGSNLTFPTSLRHLPVLKNRWKSYVIYFFRIK